MNYFYNGKYLLIVGYLRPMAIMVNTEFICYRTTEIKKKNFENWKFEENSTFSFKGIFVKKIQLFIENDYN